MDEQLLDAVCDRLKPVLYTENSYVIREGDPVAEMLFVMRGRLISATTNGGRTGFFNSVSLKASDFCGEDLLPWALDPQSSSHFPISTRTVQALTEVEAFALTAEDLKSVASQFRRLHSKQLQHTFRFGLSLWLCLFCLDRQRLNQVLNFILQVLFSAMENMERIFYTSSVAEILSEEVSKVITR